MYHDENIMYTEQAGYIFLTDMIACTSCDFQHVDLRANSRSAQSVRGIANSLGSIYTLVLNCPGGTEYRGGNVYCGTPAINRTDVLCEKHITRSSC